MIFWKRQELKGEKPTNEWFLEATCGGGLTTKGHMEIGGVLKCLCLNYGGKCATVNICQNLQNCAPK